MRERFGRRPHRRSIGADRKGGRMDQDREFIARRAAMISAGAWRDETLLDHFSRHLAAAPEKTAIVARRSETGVETRLTYRELDRLSDVVAIGLSRRGVGEGDVVSFQLPNWWEFSVLHLACLKLGAVSNPLMIIFRERELSLHARSRRKQGLRGSRRVPRRRSRRHRPRGERRSSRRCNMSSWSAARATRRSSRS